MRVPFRLSTHAWWLAPLLVLCLSALVDARRISRVLHVSSLGEAPPPSEASSPTGYVGGQRQLIIPEHNVESYQLISQTQQMLAEDTWRVRRTSMDNAPKGRDVHTPSPYRWWLRFLAWLDHAASGRPIGQSVEQAALVSGPLLRALALLALAAFTARHFGRLAAVLFSAGWIGLFPFSVAFLPAQPESSDLAAVLTLASFVALFAAVAGQDPGRHPGRTSRLLVLSGVLGGLGLWVSVQLLVPLIAGICLGVAVWKGFARKAGSTDEPGAGNALSWSVWGWAGAVTALLGFALEYLPSSPGSWRLEVIHPVYAVSWLGLSILLDAIRPADRAATSAAPKRRWLRVVLGAAGAVALPLLLWRANNPGFLLSGPLDLRLHGLPDSPSIATLSDWTSRILSSPGFWICLTPLLLLVPAFQLLRTPLENRRGRAALALAAGPLAVATVFGCFRLRWWENTGILLLALLPLLGLALSRESLPRPRKTGWLAAVLLLLLPGSVLTLSSAGGDIGDTVAESDAESLIERRLASWLNGRMGPGAARLLASPKLSASLSYYGGTQALASPYWENEEGFRAAVRIASAVLPDEAQALAAGRELTHIALASWSPELGAMSRLGPKDGQKSLIDQLQEWVPPRWLRPVPYRLPQMPGFEDQSLAVFEVTELQDQATALARLAEYFAEMDQMNSALAVVGTMIHHFPNDLRTSATRALVAIGRRDRKEYTEALQILLRRYAQPTVDELLWDRRVSIALVLAQAERAEQARATVEACLVDVDEANLRSVSPGSLYRFLVLVDALRLEFSDPALRRRAVQMLPPELQSALPDRE